MPLDAWRVAKDLMRSPHVGTLMNRLIANANRSGNASLRYEVRGMRFDVERQHPFPYSNHMRGT